MTFPRPHSYAVAELGPTGLTEGSPTVQAGLPSPVPQEVCVGVQEAHPSWHLGLWARGDPGHLSATSTDAKTCGPGKQQRPAEGVPCTWLCRGGPASSGTPAPHPARAINTVSAASVPGEPPALSDQGAAGKHTGENTNHIDLIDLSFPGSLYRSV